MAEPPDPNKFLKLIDLDLDRRRSELKKGNSRGIFMWRVLTAIGLVFLAICVYWLLGYGTEIRDKIKQKAPVQETATGLVESGER